MLKELNDMVATKYSLHVAPILCIIFYEVAEKGWEIFCDIFLQVERLKECLSHKAAARRVEGVEEVGELCILLEWEISKGIKINIWTKNILFLVLKEF
jgi:hypothetical protein